MLRTRGKWLERLSFIKNRCHARRLHRGARVEREGMMVIKGRSCPGENVAMIVYEKAGPAGYSTDNGQCTGMFIPRLMHSSSIVAGKCVCDALLLR